MQQGGFGRLLGKLLAALEEEATKGATPLSVSEEAGFPMVEPLSPRETEVLRLLTTRLSHAEMAEELVAEGGQHPLPHPGEKVPPPRRGRIDGDQGTGDPHRRDGQPAHVARGNVLVDGHLDQVGCRQRQGRRRQHQHKGCGHAPSVGAQEGQQPEHDARIAEGANGWYQACERLGQTASYLADVARAWRLAELSSPVPGTADGPGFQCRYALIATSLKSLAGNHDAEAMERACGAALSHGAYRLRTIRELLKRRTHELQGQFDFLRDYRCDMFQGDYFGRPMAEADFCAYFRQRAKQPA